MKLIPKPENKDIRLNMMITPSLDEKLRKAAEDSGVTKSEAARFILENFFSDDSEKVVTGRTGSKNNSKYEKIGVPS